MEQVKQKKNLFDNLFYEYIFVFSLLFEFHSLAVPFFVPDPHSAYFKIVAYL